MKRLLLYALFLVLLLQLVDAVELFNGEVKDNVAFNVADVSHVARYYPSAKKVSLLAGTDRQLIAVGDCQDIGSMKYCIDSASEGYNEETGDPASTMQIRVLQSGADISVDVSVSTDEPNLNEEVEVTVTLQNNGNERASNIAYEDSYPSSVKVSSAFYNVLKNGIGWVGSLDRNKTQVLTYKIKPQEFVSFNMTGIVSFVAASKMNKVKADPIRFIVKKPYEISDEISAKSVGTDEDIIYKIYINNTDSAQTLTVSKLEITVPKDSIISYRDVDLEISGNKLLYDGQMSAGTSKSFSCKIKSSKPLSGTISATVELKAGGKVFTDSFSHTVGIGISDIVPEIILNPEVVKGGGELEVEAKITNNGESKVTGISLDMTSDLVGPSGWRDLSLEPGKKHYGYNKIISAPGVDEEKIYFIELKGSYKNAAGRTMKFELKKEVTVTPQERVVELKPEFIVKGKEVNVTLKVKNVAGYKLTYVSLIDTLPAGFKMTAGSRDKDLESLGIGEDIVAYSYIVKVPDIYTKKSFEITHDVNALNKDEEKILYEKKTNVSLDGSASSVETTTAGTVGNATEDKENKSTAGEASATSSDEEKPGIFTRMWRWIKGIFVKEKPAESFE